MAMLHSGDEKDIFDVLAENTVLLAAFLHFVFLLLFVWVGARSLALVNVASVFAHLLAFVLIKRGHCFKGFLIAILEIVVHAVTATVVIGWSSGFHYYLFLLVPLAAFSTTIAMRTQLFLAATAIVGYIAFDVLLRQHRPMLELARGVLDTLYYFNFASVMLLLSFIAFFYRHLIERKEAALIHVANTDPLTQLPNRRRFMQAVNEELSRAGDERGHFHFIIGDLDHFKSINDRYGHETGDAVLRSVGRLLAREIRDPRKLCRWGGEEFLVMLASDEPQHAVFVAERLRKGVEDLDFPHEGKSLRLSMTLGVTSLLRFENVEHAIARADMGLYKGKDLGRNCVVLIEPQ